jgi:hypothetical protein
MWVMYKAGSSDTRSNIDEPEDLELNEKRQSQKENHCDSSTDLGGGRNEELVNGGRVWELAGDGYTAI